MAFAQCFDFYNFQADSKLFKAGETIVRVSNSLDPMPSYSASHPD